MSNHLDGEIFPGKSVGKYELGWTLNTLLDELKVNYQSKHLKEEVLMIETEGISFYLNLVGSHVKIYLIRVSEPYRGKFSGNYGIGTMMKDVTAVSKYDFDDFMLQNYHWYEFVLEKFNGIRFHTKKPWNDETEIVTIDVDLSVFHGAGYFD
jgi:hypothetical protein